MPTVLADTSAIIEFFRPGGQESVRREVTRLLRQGELAICGIVIAELLQGVRESEREAVEALIDEAQIWELSLDDYTRAGTLSNQLRRKGHKIPLTDCIIAALALRKEAVLLTLDLKDFGMISGLNISK